MIPWLISSCTSLGFAAALVRLDSVLSWSRLPVGYSLLVGFSFNELNKNKLLKPPLYPQMRCASLPSGSSVRLGHNFFEEKYFRRN
jgi:hypothetical protein